MFGVESKEQKMKKTFTFIDLFAGCGGLSLGFEQAGFAPVFANEIVPFAAETYKRNHDIAEENVVVEDIRALIPNLPSFKKVLNNADVVCGGPPCQGFSMANRQRIIDDPRNVLYKSYLDFVAYIRPKFFVMENVRGMASRIDEILDNFRAKLSDEYSLAYSLLSASDFGVPQNRIRFILIGNRVGVDSRKIFDDIARQSKSAPNFVLKDALYGLPELGHREKGAANIESDEAGYFECPFAYPQTKFYEFINGGRRILKLYNHKNRYNNERDIEIYRRLPQGGDSLHESIADIMPYKRRNGIFKDKYFKLCDDELCKTITSHMRFDCNMYIHPWYARGLTAREAARIQTFPDDFVFLGAPNSWYFQAGNAVPVKLAEAIAKGVRKWL